MSAFTLPVLQDDTGRNSDFVLNPASHGEGGFGKGVNRLAACRLGEHDGKTKQSEYKYLKRLHLSIRSHLNNCEQNQAKYQNPCDEIYSRILVVAGLCQWLCSLTERSANC